MCLQQLMCQSKYSYGFLINLLNRNHTIMQFLLWERWVQFDKSHLLATPKSPTNIFPKLRTPTKYTWSEIWLVVVVTKRLYSVIKKKMIGICLCDLANKIGSFRGHTWLFTNHTRLHKPLYWCKAPWHMSVIFKIGTPGSLLNIQLNYDSFQCNIIWLSKRLRKNIQKMCPNLCSFTNDVELTRYNEE